MDNKQKIAELKQFHRAATILSQAYKKAACNMEASGVAGLDSSIEFYISESDELASYADRYEKEIKELRRCKI